MWNSVEAIAFLICNFFGLIWGGKCIRDSRCFFCLHSSAQLPTELCFCVVFWKTVAWLTTLELKKPGGFKLWQGFHVKFWGVYSFRKMMKAEMRWGLPICFRDTCDWWHPTAGLEVKIALHLLWHLRDLCLQDMLRFQKPGFLLVSTNLIWQYSMWMPICLLKSLVFDIGCLRKQRSNYIKRG